MKKEKALRLIVLLAVLIPYTSSQADDVQALCNSLKQETVSTQPVVPHAASGDSSINRTALPTLVPRSPSSGDDNQGSLKPGTSSTSRPIIQLDPDFEFPELARINDPDGYTNLRRSPSINSDVICIIKEGDIFLVHPDASQWWKVKTINQSIGFIHKSRVKLEFKNPSHYY
jgi:hypothetical protein